MLTFQFSWIWSHFIKGQKDNICFQQIGPNHIKEDFNGSESELQNQCHDEHSHETQSGFTNFLLCLCIHSIMESSCENIYTECQFIPMVTKLYFRVLDPHGIHALASSLLSQCQGPGHSYRGGIVTARGLLGAMTISRE